MDRNIAGESKSGQSESLTIHDDSFVPNGYVRCHPLHEELADDCDAERVGVLDYMPLSRHVTTDASQKSAPVALHRLRTGDRNSSLAESFDCVTPCPDEPKNIELTTFRITECRDRRNLVPCSSCASDDDELLGAEADDYLHEVVVQSSDDIPGDGPERSGQAISGIARASLGDREVSSLLRCIPSSFGATRDGAWSRPDTGCESPSVDNGESVSHDLEEDTFTNYRISSYESGCVATTTMDKRDDEALGDRSQHHESSTVVVEDEKDPEVQLGSNSLPPVEVVSVDRSPMDPSSISRSNVLYLNDYSLWTNAARAFCRDESASDRSEVEKRQERRDKRRERRGHERTVKAEEIEGYMGMKEVMDLVEYIQGEVEKSKDGVLPLGKKEVVKMSKRVKESETSVMPPQGEPEKSSDMPQKKLTQKQKATSKTSQKTTPLNVPETADVDLEQRTDASVGTVIVSVEMLRSEENAENDGMLEQPYGKESSTSVENFEETELDPSENPSSTSKELERTSTRSNSLEPEESMWQSTQLAAEFHSTTVNSPTQKSASKPDEPEQMLGHGSKKSKKPNNKKNRNAQVADKTRRVSLENRETTSTTSQSLSSTQPSQEDNSAESFLRTSQGGTLAVDCTTATLSESELSADATSEDVSHLSRYPYKSSSAQDYIQDQDDDWKVHTRKHPKSRAKFGDAENRTSSQGEQNTVVWKDQSSKPPPGYRKPEGRAPFGRVGSINDGYQGQKFPHPSGSRGRQGSTSSLNLETSNSTGKVGSRTFWGSRESKENPKMSDMPRKFPNQRSCMDDVQSRKEESVTYARITAGEPVWPPCQSVKLVGVEEATPGQSSSNPDGASEVPSQIIDEADRMPDEPSANVNTEPDGAGTGGDLPLKASTETVGTDLVSTPKEQPRSDTTSVSVTMKQVRSDTTLSEGLASSSQEQSRSAGNISSDSKQDDHSRVADRRLSEICTPEVDIYVTETETKENQSMAEATETKPIVVSIDKDAATQRQNLPKTETPVPQQKRNPELKTKTLAVEFSKRFKGAKVDGISFCFDPTVADSKSQGLSSFSDRTPTLESSNNSGGTISNRLVSGPTYSTTMVPAGGGLQSQSSGTSVSNCSRPIAPLSGPGHTSGAKTPVVVVNPMQLARGHAEPSQTIVGNYTDPEILKEVMVPLDSVRIDDAVAPMLAKIVTTVSSPVFPSKANDFTGAMLADLTRLPATNNIPTQPQPQQLNESPVTMSMTEADSGSGLALAKRVTFVEEPQLETASESRTEVPGPPSTHQLRQSDPRPKHLEPVSLHASRDVQLDAPQQQFVPPWGYMLCRPYLMYPQLPQAVPGVYHQGMVPPVGPRQDAALALPKVPKQPRFRQEQHAVRVAVPVPSLVLIQNYIYNEFQKVLEEEKHDPTKVLRYRED